MKNIFISYSPKDSRPMLLLQEALVRGGLKPWIDPTPRPGMDWRLDIDEAIIHADVIVVLITPNSAESVYVTYEWALALGLGIPVVPIIYRSARLHPRLANFPGFDVNAWKDEYQFWDYVVVELKRMAAPGGPLFRQTVQAPAIPSAPAPVPVSVAPAPAAPVPVVPAKPQVDRSLMPDKPGYWLVIRRGPNLNMMYRLEGAVVNVGREPTNDIPIAHSEMSRHHFRLIFQGNAYAIEDMSRTNPTLVNGVRPIGIMQLIPGCLLSIGDAIVLSYEVVA